MIFPVSRRFRVAAASAAAGVSLVVALGACSSGGGHNVATAQVCSDLTTQSQQMQAAVLAGAGAILVDPSSASPADQAKAVSAVKAAFTTLAQDLRTESGKASDSGLSKALSLSADEIDSANNNLKTVDDLNNLGSMDSTALTSLATYCPGLNTTGE